ncbi:MAG: polysaccharide deacetylase [Massilioclostridium sp.]|nr:MAG: polysaccharide deacetylase [Massilioclostridium sp.]
MMKNYKKIAIQLVAVGLASTILTGCGTKGKDSSSQTSSKVPLPSTSSSPVINAVSPTFGNLDTKKQGWGQGVQFDEQNIPISCTTFQEKYGKYNAVFVKQNCENQIFLTFDEGYENGYTSKILDVLKEKQVPAVFFVTYDYASKNPDLIQRMIDEGHIVGNHSYSHPSMPEISVEKQQEEITKLHDYIKQEFSYTMTLFRPPKGEFSEQSLAVAKELGYETVFWSFAYSDWNVDKQPDPSEALKKTVDRAHNGAVYLLHAVSKTNTEILGNMIDQLQQEGYSFQPMAE